MSIHCRVCAKRPSRPIYSKVATNIHVKTNAHYRNVHLRVIEATAVRALNVNRHIPDVKKVSDIGNLCLHLPFPCIFRDFILCAIINPKLLSFLLLFPFLAMKLYMKSALANKRGGSTPKKQQNAVKEAFEGYLSVCAYMHLH